MNIKNREGEVCISLMGGLQNKMSTANTFLLSDNNRLHKTAWFEL